MVIELIATLRATFSTRSWLNMGSPYMNNLSLADCLSEVKYEDKKSTGLRASQGSNKLEGNNLK